MASGLRDNVVQRLPGIGWRAELLAKRSRQVSDLRKKLETAQRHVADRQAAIRDLQGQVRALEAQVAQEELAAETARVQLAQLRPDGRKPAPPPSFLRHLMELRRGVAPLRELDPDGYHPVLQIPRKLRNYRLAASHGLAVPEVFASWRYPEEIDLSDLPEQFVLKCEIGSGGSSVFPLRQVGGGRVAVVGGGEVHTRDSLVRRFRDHKTAWGPYFVEEFLTQRVTGEEIPDDIKIYACYGEVVMVMLRQMPAHADLRRARYRYVDAQGRDLGTDVAPDRAVHSSIPLPEPLEEFVQLAAHLSRAVALPFVRVDLYDTVRGPVLGELTRNPGGSQRYRADQDAAMGRAWDAAQWRLEMDVIDGRPLRNLHGLHETQNYYPAYHASNQPDPQGWEMVRADCAQWCFGGHLPASGGAD